jgi:rod shape-determining protein MreC
MWRRTTRHRSIIAAVLVATVVLLTLDLRTGIVNGMSGVMTEILGVFQAGVRTVVRPIEGAVGSIRDLGQLRDENADLRAENAQLRDQAARFRGVARENAELRRLMTLEDSLSITDGVRARVIGGSLSPLQRYVEIDKGESDGIVEGTAVLAPEGLVGRISWTGGRASRVQLLTDAQSAIGVKVDRNGETGLAQGTGRRTLRLELVDRAALDRGSIRVNDVLLTSGMQGGIFPPDIPIGVIEEVDRSARGSTYRIVVRPLVRLSRLDIVTVAPKPEVVAEAPPRDTDNG